jgi:hypothetical protein
VGLVRHMGSDVTAVENFRLFDHFVVEGGGLWFFRVSPGTYGLVAFADRKADLIYQPGEPFLRVDPHRLLVCVSSEEKRDIALVIPEDGRPSIAGDIAITELQARTVHDQLTASVGLLSAIGVITTLDDPRFRLENAASGMWAPFDFVFNFRPGVYFLQAYDHNKIPVLFVHGINGTPTSFRFLIERLDSHTFQPWVYYYPFRREPQPLCRLSQPEERLGGVPGVKQHHLWLARAPVAGRAQQLQGQRVLRRPPCLPDPEGYRNPALPIRPDQQHNGHAKDHCAVFARPDPGGLAKPARLRLFHDGVIDHQVSPSDRQEGAQGEGQECLPGPIPLEHACQTVVRSLCHGFRHGRTGGNPGTI